MGSIDFLKKLTAARVALGHTGVSIPTRQTLEFKLAHAHARDAVYSSMNNFDLREQLKEFDVAILELHSRAKDRAEYLQRPDLGRRLDKVSAKHIAFQPTGYDISICIADGLSATAVHENAAALLSLLIPKLLRSGFSLAPIALISQGRVAIADDIGMALQARLTVILIGERPGLSAADSLGVYLTYQPQPGLTDDSRNCISNIRRSGLAAEKAADKIVYLITEAFRRKLSGILLKDDEAGAACPT